MALGRIIVRSRLRSFPYTVPIQVAASQAVAKATALADAEAAAIKAESDALENGASAEEAKAAGDAARAASLANSGVTETDSVNSFLDTTISNLSQSVALIPSDISMVLGTGGSTTNTTSNDAWKGIALPSLDKIEKITTGLGKAMDKISKIVTILEKVLKIIELFMSAFNSFSKLIVSAINLAQTKLNSYADSALGLGVYVNAIAPPAFMTFAPTDPDIIQKARGGFEGFMGRLQASLNDTTDNNRPKFNGEDYVGGCIFLVDTESIDEVWTALTQLAGLFDFMKLFGLNLAPPPPNNINGFCGYFSDSEDTKAPPKYGVQIEWDNNYISGATLVYRSRIPNGTSKTVTYLPSSLVDDKENNEPGLLRLAKGLIQDIFSHKALKLPEKIEQVYEDPDFNGGEPVKVINSFGPKTTFVDRFFTTQKKNGIEVPVIKDNGKYVPVTQYYYVLRSKSGPKGPISKELVVPIQACNNGYSMANVIPQPNGSFEFLTVGHAKGLNSWSTIQVNAMIPWFTDLIKLLNKFLESLKGMVTNASDSFIDFINQIKAKIVMYINILKVVAWLIESLKNFLIGPSISFLNLTPMSGGMDKFMQRIRSAKLPDGKTSFSGPKGITIGIVIVYGAGQASLIKDISKAITIVQKLIGK